jgi:hypothetical protein
MEIGQKFELLKPGSIQQEIAAIRRIIVDPSDPDASKDKWRRRQRHVRSFMVVSTGVERTSIRGVQVWS